MQGDKRASRCKVHALPGMVDIRHRRCSEPGCDTHPSYGMQGDKRASRCKVHALPGMINIAHSRCSEPGCDTIPIYGMQGDKRASRCNAHALPGMVDIRNQRCSQPGCDTRPSYGMQGDKRPSRCKAHALPGMNDIVNPRCSEPGCDTLPSYGVREDKRASRCKVHALPGMIDIVSKRCSEPGCDTRPIYGMQGDKRPTRCKAHALPGMIDIANSRCSEPGCDTHPNYGMQGDKRASRCRVHALLGMIDIVSPRCSEPGCDVSARYGPPGHRPVHCARHKRQGEAARPRARCSECRELGTHDLEGVRFCECHAPTGSRNIALRPCASCGLADILDSSDRCPTCDPVRAAKVAKRHEMQVKAFLDVEIANGELPPYETHDRMIDGGACVRVRPDFVWDAGTHVLVLEVDENQHQHYACECEQARMANVGQAMGIATLFVRYNPDKYKALDEQGRNRAKNPTLAKRMQVLKCYLASCVKPEYAPRAHGAFVRAVYLYYDGWDESRPEWKNIVSVDN